MDILLSSEYRLLQNSIPDETLLFITRLCRKHGIRIILKPSGYKMSPPEVLEELYMLVPNKTELNQIMPGEGTVGEKAAALIAGGARYVVVTLGKRGAILLMGRQGRNIRPLMWSQSIQPGPAMHLSVRWQFCFAEGESIDTAIEYATIAAGISNNPSGCPVVSAGPLYTGNVPQETDWTYFIIYNPMRVRVKTLYKNHLSAYYRGVQAAISERKGDIYGEESHCF